MTRSLLSFVIPDAVRRACGLWSVVTLAALLAMAVPVVAADAASAAAVAAGAAPSADVKPGASDASPGAAPGTAPTADVDTLVETFNPDMFALDANGAPKYVMKNAFQEGASDIAGEVAGNNTFNLLVYLPFLVLPQILLVIIIFKFRDRGDGRKPATFMGNHALEITWTLIPCLALVVVAMPVWHLLYKMELPPVGVDTNDPKAATVIHVTGKEWTWQYDYKHENLTISVLDQAQQALVLPRGRAVVMTLTSNDVNHAWWVPAFGVKRDCIKGRDTFIWFTPTQDGVFKGTCAQLCGQGHGVMFISAVVVEPRDYDLFISLLRQRSDTNLIWFALQRKGLPPDQDGLKAAVATYLAKEDTPFRRYALRYWITTDFALERHTWQGGALSDDPKEAARVAADRANQDDLEHNWKDKRSMVEALLAGSPAPTPSAINLVPPAAPVAVLR